MKNLPIRVLPDLSYGPHGQHNRLDLYLPLGGRSLRPLLVCIHGGGWAAGNKEDYGWVCVDLARHGIAAATINYRFAPRWHWPTQLDDVQAAVRWLRSRAHAYGLDGRRFGALGGSAGGHLASFLGLVDTRDERAVRLARYSSRVVCVVDCYGPVDLPAMMCSASAPIVQGLVGRPPSAAPQAYRQASPAWQVRGRPPAFLIVHGTADTGAQIGQVPIGISRRFAATLRAAGSDVTLLALPGAPHGFTGQPWNEHFRAAWKRIVPWCRARLRVRR